MEEINVEHFNKMVNKICEEIVKDTSNNILKKSNSVTYNGEILSDRERVALFYQCMATIGSSLIASTAAGLQKSLSVDELKKNKAIEQLKAHFMMYWTKATGEEF